MNVEEYRILFVGDELVAGVGDARALGWTGRVLARTETESRIVGLPLAIPGENTADLSSRWSAEVLPRLSKDADNRLVIGLGSHDLDTGISLARARLNLANMLDQATRHQLHPFVVGPPPRHDADPKAQSDLSNAYRDVAQRRDIPFVDTYHPLATHDQWQTDTVTTSSYTPQQAGYGLLAWLVLHNGWHNWLGIKN